MFLSLIISNTAKKISVKEKLKRKTQRMKEKNKYKRRK